MTLRRDEPVRSRRQSMVVVDAALGLIICLLVVQMWLLTASLEEYLAGHHDVAIPGAICSGILFAGCFALYLLVRRFEVAERRKSL
jgi:hypothetical protein